jgi:hypothetical protein
MSKPERKPKTQPDRRYGIALGATAAVIAPVKDGSKRPDDLGALTALLEKQRRQRGQPLLWVQNLRNWSSRDIAGAVLHHLVSAAVWSETDDAEYDGMPPYRLTVATALGAEFFSEDADPDLMSKVGDQLLDAAETLGVIEKGWDDGMWGGHRVRVSDDLFRQMQGIINGARRSIIKQYPLRVPTITGTKQPHEMLIPRPDVPPRVLEAIQKLQATPWRINRAVLAVLIDEVVGKAVRDEYKTERRGERRWKKEKALIFRDEVIIQTACVLSNHEPFYIPMRLDFRGRAYQLGALTYTSGSDYARSLLEFASGEELDDSGRGWLGWHAAQMWGTRKDREVDPAPDQPLGHGWDWKDEALKRTDRWREADKPAQFLAAALALKDAQAGLRVHLPVRCDATCSGLQHLALLGRDVELAKAVNLWEDIPGMGLLGDRSVGALFLGLSQKPDFYQAVATATGFKRKEAKAVIVPLLYGAGDKATGHPKQRYKLSKALARARRGETARRTARDSRDVLEIKRAAMQLAPGALGTTNRQGVLGWFTDVAEAHRSALKTALAPEPVPIRWTTPSGFEVVQDYRLRDLNPDRPDRRVRIPLSGGRMHNFVKAVYTPLLDPGQQTKAFAANLVHSLDAAFLTELVARAPIEQWATAHDAFAVPANRMWALLGEPLTDTLRLYETDWLCVWTQAWRDYGIAVPDPPEHARGLPPEMLHGLGTLG